MTKIYLFRFTYLDNPTFFAVAEDLETAAALAPFSEDVVSAARIATCSSMTLGGTDQLGKGVLITGEFRAAEEF